MDGGVCEAHCAVCHQKSASGLPGQFARLAGRVAEIATTEAGRRYLIEVVSFDLSGRVEVDGAAIVGAMPPFASLSDSEVAVVLNYPIRLNRPASKDRKPVSVAASEVKELRGR
jgi:mono/diheme cytochrome c family protein